MWSFSVQCDSLCLLLCKSSLSASDNSELSTDPSCPSNDDINVVCNSSNFFGLIFKCWTWTQLYTILSLVLTSLSQCLHSLRMNSRKKPSKDLLHLIKLGEAFSNQNHELTVIDILTYKSSRKKVTTTIIIKEGSIFNAGTCKIEENH